MRMFISLIHWVRKEISFHWRETDETCWAFGAIFFYSSLTCLIALVLAPKDLSKANRGHHYLPCILSSSLISFLSPLELLMLHTVHSFDVEQMKRLFPGFGTCLCLPLPGWQISDFKFMMTIKENNRKKPTQNKQTTIKKKRKLAHLSTGTVVTASDLALSLVWLTVRWTVNHTIMPAGVKSPKERNAIFAHCQLFMCMPRTDCADWWCEDLGKVSLEK